MGMDNTSTETTDMATKLREYWWDELAGETVEVTDPAQLDGDGWEPTGRQHGAATEWQSDRGHQGLLIHALTHEEAEASVRLFWSHEE